MNRRHKVCRKGDCEMFKYKIHQFGKARGEWFEILSCRFGLFDDRKEYLVGNGEREGWIKEEDIEEVTKEINYGKS
jgi:hypothetical protein